MKEYDLNKLIEDKKLLDEKISVFLKDKIIKIQKPEQVKEIRKKCYDKYREQNVKKASAYKKENPEKNRHYSRKSAIKRKKRIQFVIERLNLPLVTKKDMDNILFRDNYKCVYCGESDLKKLCKTRGDHIIPVKDKEGYDIKENLVTCCSKCNNSKKGSNVFEWCKRRKIEVPGIVIKLLKKQIEMGVELPENIKKNL